jgi:hypothetical protein
MLISKTDTLIPFIFTFIFFFTEAVVRQILDVGPTHQAKLQDLISEGCKIFGYVRKSPGKESITTRLRLLESMVDRLMKTSSTYGFLIG